MHAYQQVCTSEYENGNVHPTVLDMYNEYARESMEIVTYTRYNTPPRPSPANGVCLIRAQQRVCASEYKKNSNMYQIHFQHISSDLKEL